MKISHRTGVRIFIIIFLFILCGISAANEVLLKYKSKIDWQKGYVVSRGKSQIAFNEEGDSVDMLTGKAIPLNRAREINYNSAKEFAIAIMADTIKSMRIDSQNSLLDIMKTSNDTQRSISDKINKNVVFKEYPAEFDSSVCEAKLNFGSIIASLPFDYPSDDFPVRTEVPISTPYTALIVDGRGHNIKPMLFPSVYSDSGLEIFGRRFIDSSQAVKRGMVSYCYNEDQAFIDARSGNSPYFAAAVDGLNNCPVISEKDTRRLLSSRQTINNLKKCRVIFIIDKADLMQ
ncbi:MAG: hypothetical protein V1874_00720 [Spirochaetota bacterium]